MTPQDTNIDDYYSNIPQIKEEDANGEKKSPFKLKLKVKKVEDNSASLETEEKIVEKVEKSEETPKIKIKNQPTIITFEERKELPKIEKQEFKSTFKSPDRPQRTEYRSEPRRDFNSNK